MKSNSNNNNGSYASIPNTTFRIPCSSLLLVSILFTSFAPTTTFAFLAQETNILRRQQQRHTSHEIRHPFSADDVLDGEVVGDVEVLELTSKLTRRADQTSQEEEEEEQQQRQKQHQQKQRMLSEEDSSKFSSLPPWLVRSDMSSPEQIEVEVQGLEYSMLEQGFAVKDIADVVKAIYFCASGDVQKIIGSIEFCRLMLSLEEPDQTHRFFITKDVLLASILHYSEAVTSRRTGVYEKVRKALGMDGMPGVGGTPTIYLEPPPSVANDSDEDFMEDEDSEEEDYDDDEEEFNMDDESLFPKASITLRQKLSVPDRPVLPENGIDFFTLESLTLAQGASRIKRAEILADVVLTDKRAIKKEDYSQMRNLMLSVMDDWRSLAIRCVAYLYRLEGILHTMPVGTGEYIKRSNEVTLAARNSMRVYANLSQRLGLHRLKLQLEARAFRILYPRQYGAVSTLFNEKGDSMKAVSTFLSSQISGMVREDQSLMSKLEDIEVTARVKEPYSFWKKLLKKRSAQGGGKKFLSRGSSISVLDVQDGVALRVILKAKKESPDEDIETTRSRERMLCYYVHHLIRSRWPATDPSRVKDYIRNPKPNGYQSLHHTSAITRNLQDFPFEVQVRSYEMHQVAEFGVAAHFDYKTDGPAIGALTPAQRYLKDLERTSLAKSTPVPTDREGLVPKADGSSYITALQSARETLVQNNVYVFLPGSSFALEEGQIVSIPAGALVVDCLAELKKNYNLNTEESQFQVWRNGKLALLDDVVRNGDVILLQKVPWTRERLGSSAYLVTLGE